MFIDMHHHLIYGIDDGARDFAGTERMIRQAVENRVGAIITTPHMMPGVEPFPEDDYRTRLDEVQKWLENQQLDLTLYPGAEVLYTPNTPHMLAEGRVPSLANSSLVLLEFLPDSGFSEMMRAGVSIARTGYVPVYAHIERCLCLKKTDQVRQLRQECGAFMQVNANTVLRRHGFFRQRFLNALFENGLVDFVASDSHDMQGRENHMAAAFEQLSERFGKETALALTIENAKKWILRE